jgi:hypothetical protein
MSVIRRVVMTGTAIVAVFALTAMPAAAAANDNASCVGIIASAQAPKLDVDQFKKLADEAGAKNFGQFVAGGAKLHAGSLEACLP